MLVLEPCTHVTFHTEQEATQHLKNVGYVGNVHLPLEAAYAVPGTQNH